MSASPMVSRTSGDVSLAAAVRNLAGRGHRTLLVTSAAPGDGRSTVTLATAIGLATTGSESVLIVDADPGAPSLHRAFGCYGRRGLGELIEEVYDNDPTKEEPLQFGIGDWLEILRARQATGELTIRGDGRAYMLRLVKGSVACLANREGDAGTRLGETLVEEGRITAAQCADALKIHEESGRPLGEVLMGLGWLPREGLADALRGQVSRRLARLVAIARPECRFTELVEPHRPASGGRSPEMPERQDFDALVFGHFHGFLKQPFLSSQIPSYITDSGIENLKLLVAGRKPSAFAGARFAAAFPILLQRLARIYDVILVDGPPAPSPLTSVLAGATNGVLMVARAGGPSAGVRQAADALRRSGSPVLGVILNRSDAAPAPVAKEA